ncbi:MAG: MBL fold metallo-hydrolase [Bacilli bacterium]
MRFHVFESGSAGNCTLITSKGRAIIIDCGISNRKLKKKLSEVGSSLDEVKALLVTHNHSDHISGIASSFDRENIYCSQRTYDVPMSNYLIPYETYHIGGFEIQCIPTSHDAPSSLGFIIKDEEETLVYITDTGYIYDRVCELVVNATYYIFESNHNVRMELSLPRSRQLIDRILGDRGHLSNVDAANYLTYFVGPKTKEIVLAHLSKEANTPELALQECRKVFLDKHVKLDHILLRCASQVDTVSGGSLDYEREGI